MQELLEPVPCRDVATTDRHIDARESYGGGHNGSWPCLIAHAQLLAGEPPALHQARTQYSAAEEWLGGHAQDVGHSSPNGAGQVVIRALDTGFSFHRQIIKCWWKHMLVNKW